MSCPSRIRLRSRRGTRQKAPLKAWFRIPFLDFDVVGDHKVIRELNRHQHLITLAKAWCFTQQERYIHHSGQQFGGGVPRSFLAMGASLGGTVSRHSYQFRGGSADDGWLTLGRSATSLMTMQGTNSAAQALTAPSGSMHWIRRSPKVLRMEFSP